jgi:hypothetical protein
MLFIVTWIITYPLPLPVAFGAALLSIYVSFVNMPYRMQSTQSLNNESLNMIRVASKIKPLTVVLPLNYSDNWLHINLSNYIGAHRNVIVLDNYESLSNEFPLTWNENTEPGNLAGNFGISLNPFVSVEKYEHTTGIQIDYVTRWKFIASQKDTQGLKTDSELRRIFRYTFHEGSCDIFHN